MSSERYEIAPERLGRWLGRWTERHGPIVACALESDGVRLRAADGSELRAVTPFGAPSEGTLEGLLAHVRAERTVGVLLVRLGAHAAGIFEGSRLTSSKVTRRQVHGRNRKGGSSSGRFARRRENQADASLAAAADVAARILVPHAARLDAVVLGGDRRAAEQVLSDPRLRPLRDRVEPRVIDVPEPRLEVLRQAPERFLATTLLLADAVDPR